MNLEDIIEYIMNTLQFLGGIVLSVGYIPQIRQILKTKSVKDFNIVYLSSLTVGVGFMEIYAIYNLIKGVAIMFFVTNTIAFLLAVTMLVLYKIYNRKEIK
jgi:MtN3 and saliva related transmembrane protein